MSTTELIEIYRSGPALWLVVDGKPLPEGLVSSVSVDVDEDIDEAEVRLTINAKRVIFDAAAIADERRSPDRQDEDDGEAEDGEEEQGPGPVRDPGKEEEKPALVNA